jgi:hypothetical protein
MDVEEGYQDGRLLTVTISLSLHELERKPQVHGCKGG